VGIEKIGRGLAMPLMMAVAWKLGASAPLIAGAWALTAAPALVASMSAFRSLSRRARSESPPAAEDLSARADFAAQDFGDDRNRRFWRFASARAIGQTFEVGVNWVDTLIIGAMLSATQAGIYASGTRYALLGSFTSDAMMQVSGPSVAASLARGDREEANRSVRHVTAWQTLLVWPMYLLVLCYSTPLLKVFGHTTVEARPALMFLSLGMMIQSLAGPAASVILMDGKSTTALFNTMISLGFNVLANLWAIPRYGISGAGAVWAITIVIQGWLPAFQAHTTLRIATFGRPGVMASLCALFSFGVAGIVFRLIFGETWAGLVIALVVGSMLFVPMVWANRKVLALDALVPRRFLDRMGPRGHSSLGGTLDTTAHRSRS
jgi:O-antigen/teichoic acid export membrane protein